MNRQRRGIRRSDDPSRGPNKYATRVRKYPQHRKVSGDLDDWSDAWKKWFDDIRAELHGVLNDYETDPKAEEHFESAVALLVDMGMQMEQSARGLLDQLNALYGGQASPAGEAEDPMTDSTQPPPPPFGKGYIPDP